MGDRGGLGGESGPAWLESSALFAHFWARFAVAVAVLIVAVALTAALDRWDRLHQWTNGLVLAGLAAWALSLILLLVLSVAGGLRPSQPGAEAPPAAALLSYSLVLAFAGLAPLGAGVILAAALT